MSRIQRKVMERFYRESHGDPERLPWHNETLPSFLLRAIEQRKGTTRALDVGCGSGVHAAQMAEKGVEVTALDFLRDAVAMARATAEERGVQVHVVEADLFSFAPEEPFDLVFDSGCLHNMAGGEVQRYRAKIVEWLAPGGDFVLGHWGKRHALDWRPIGPRRRTAANLTKLFAPALQLLDSESTDERVPIPFGPWARMSSYWFRRSA